MSHTPSNNLIVVFYLKRLIKNNMTITVSVNCQISYRLLKFKDLKSTFLLTFIEGWPLDFIFIVCVCLVM
jgi:hypothetical protein